MEILEILNAEKELLMDMLNALNTEKEALVNDDIDKLHEAVKKKEELQSKIDGIEKLRAAKCGNKKLKELINSFEGEEKAKLEQLGKDIEDTIYSVQEINDINKKLATQSLNYVRTLMNVISPPKINVYSAKGTVKNNLSSSRVLDKNL